jgi:hypothetical protein
MNLTERQMVAARLTRELQAFGATVTNRKPLPEDEPLRFWVSDYKKREILQQLADAGYEPIFTGMSQQPDIQSYTMGLVNNFELRLPRDAQPVHDDRIIRGELAEPKPKSDVERQAILKYLGIGGKK